MKIALSFPGCHRRGGIERVVLECANFLDSRGHEVALYASEWDRDALGAGVEIRPVALPRRGALPRLLAYARRCRRMMDADSAGQDVRAAFGVQSPPDGVFWVPSVHRAWLDASRTQRDWKGRLRQRANPIHPALLMLERRCFAGRRYKRLLALTEQVKADLVRWYAVPPDDIAVLPNGYAAGEFSARRAASQREAMRRSLGYGDREKVIIFVANELERKGFGPLLRAVARLNEPRARLLAVGRLDPRPYAAEIARLGLADCVQFTGPTGNAAAYYAAADLFALPTQYEAWGLVIVEALACGLPVVTSRLAGAAIAVREGETGGLLDNPNDPEEIAERIRPFLDAPPSAEQCEESVRHYAWPNILCRYERHLAECAD